MVLHHVLSAERNLEVKLYSNPLLKPLDGMAFHGRSKNGGGCTTAGDVWMRGGFEADGPNVSCPLHCVDGFGEQL